MSMLRARLHRTLPIGISTLAQRRGTSLVIVAGVACVVAGAGIDAVRRSRDRRGCTSQEAVTNARSSCQRASTVSSARACPVDSRRHHPERAWHRQGRGRHAARGCRVGTRPHAAARLSPSAISCRCAGSGPRRCGVARGLPDRIGTHVPLSGAQELLIGAGASRRFRVKDGDKVLMPGGFWPIVGTFSNGGDRSEGEFFADVRHAARQQASNPGSARSS